MDRKTFKIAYINTPMQNTAKKLQILKFSKIFEDYRKTVSFIFADYNAESDPEVAKTIGTQRWKAETLL